MYELLYDISKRPEPFSRYTAKALWTRPHLARQMLSFHLDQETDLASRRFEAIDSVVSWIDGQAGLAGKRVCDLGCGPGLYTQRFAAKGAAVMGVDFSAHSLEYAREQTAQSIQYLEADYLVDDLPMGFDVITLIYTDLCALSPKQRKKLLGRMHKMLVPGGQIVLDVAGMGSFTGKGESTTIERQLMGGFWAEGDYVGIQRSYTYPEDRLALDRYVIVEPGDTWQVFNWLQHFTPESIEAELAEAGFSIDHLAGGLSGEPLESEGEFIGIIANAV